MTKAQGTIIILILLALFISSCANMFAGGKAQTVKWAYIIEDIDDDIFTLRMQELGDEGWELAYCRRAVKGTGLSSQGIYECIFKRPKGIK